MQFLKPVSCCLVLFQEERLFAGSLSKLAVVVFFFQLYCQTFWHLMCWQSPVVWDISLFFLFFWALQSDLGMNLLGCDIWMLQNCQSLRIYRRWSLADDQVIKCMWLAFSYPMLYVASNSLRKESMMVVCNYAIGIKDQTIIIFCNLLLKNEWTP